MRTRNLLLMLSICLFMTGCNVKEDSIENITPNTNLLADSEKTDNGENPDEKESLQPKSYEAYSGLWSVDKRSHDLVLSKGDTECNITITNQTQLTASLFSQQQGSDRFAQILDITGTIEDDTCYYTFSDDGFGGSGTLQFRFLKDKIQVNVQNYKMDENNTSGFGISGFYKLKRPENSIEPNEFENQINEQNLQKIVYDKYYASWTNDSLVDAINDRRTYLEQCSFYQEVQDYLEKVREVRDGSNVVEPLYYTDLKYYEKRDFNDVPALILRLAKNEIYARRGYIFKDNDLKNYFMGQLWYEPSIQPDDFDTSIFNEYETANLKLFTELD